MTLFLQRARRNPRVSEADFNDTILGWYRQYRDYIHASRRTIYILHIDMTRTIAEDILFFYKIHLVSQQEAESIIRELFDLIDLRERICNRGDFFPNDREVHFFFCKTLLSNDVTIIESDELNQAILYANYHHPISSIGNHTFQLFRQWFNLWMHSSNIISASDPEQRFDFFRRQRDYLGHLQNKMACFR